MSSPALKDDTHNRNIAIKQESSTATSDQQRTVFKYFGYALIILITCNIFFRFLKYVLIITTLSTILIIIPIFTVSPPTIQTGGRQSIRAKFTRFKFIKTEEWSEEVKRLEDAQVYTPTCEENESESLSPLINFVIRDFVNSWFTRISKSDQTFPDEIKHLAYSLISQISNRASHLDTPKLLVIGLVPLITKHFTNFVTAQDLVTTERASSASSNELDLRIAREYDDNRKLHPHVSLRPAHYETQHKKFAREKVTKILSLILPDNEANSAFVPVILREILTNIVMMPLLRMLTDPDFWNQTIVKFAGSTLTDRVQVRELRHIIDQQYNNNNKDQMLLQTKVTPSMRQPQFEKYIKHIERCDSLPVLKQLKYTVSVQISRTYKFETTTVPTNKEKFLKYRRRLEICKNIIDARLSNISSASIPDESKRSSKMFNKPDLDAFINNLTLNQILNNPTSLSYFMEFMEQRSRQTLLQFWITVNGIKDPLEDPFTSEYEEFTQEGIEDINLIYHQFFNDPILKVSEDTRQEVASFVQSSTHGITSYSKARKSILLLQLDVLRRMNERDLADFKGSSLFLKLLESERFEESLVWEVQGGTDNADNYGVKENNGPLSKIETAITDILSKDSNTAGPSYTRAPNDDDFLSKRLSTPPRLNKIKKLPNNSQKSEIFGNSRDSFLNEKPLFGEEDTAETQEEYTSSDEEEEEEDEESEVSLINEIANDDTLDIKEAIDNLSQDIERLTHQSAILDPLILKAELTNNTTQLHLLKKSQSSYQREIEIKDLQKQQLIVQDNENSLFGKTEISINSYVTATERLAPGKEYIVYVIEVNQKKSTTATSVNSWMIGRRFNHFYQLNELLKKRYPDLLNGIPFPRKKLNVLNFQQRHVIEERRSLLEAYLKKLLGLSQICQDKEFRRFLTLDEYTPEKILSIDDSHPLSKSLSSLDYGSSNEHLPSHGKHINDPIPGLSLSTDNLRSPYLTADTNHITSTFDQPEDEDQPTKSQRQVEEMRKELDTYNKTEQSSLKHHSNQGSFIKPIIDLFLVLFQPNNGAAGFVNGVGAGGSWLRGRALVLVLQQVFGSTIENYLKKKITSSISENIVKEVIEKLTNSLWPDGEFRKSSEPRSSKEKLEARQKSKLLLEQLLLDTCSKIVGSSSVKYAGLRVHAMLQNEVLNINLVYEVIDLILEELFPEMKTR